MAELDALGFALWTAPPVYAAARRARRHPRQRPLSPLALALLVLAAALWIGSRAHLAAGVATAITALAATASVLVLLTAVRPRLAWLLAVLCPCIAAVLTVAATCAGGSHAP